MTARLVSSGTRRLTGVFRCTDFQRIFAELIARGRVCSTRHVPSTTTLGDSIPSSSGPAQGRPARVLYADDLRELQEVMRLILHSQGYQVETVSDGDEALQLLAEHPHEFELLITDHHMPRMNGLELVHRLAHTSFRGKIMVFSSELDPEVHRQYHRLGVPVILPKPIRPAVLRKALADLVPARVP